MAASRGWNYQSTNAPTGPITLSLYVDATQVSGQNVLVATLARGLVPTVLTSNAAAEAAVAGGVSFATVGTSYSVSAEVSFGSTALVPGTPVLVASPLVQGTVTTPYPGVTETVVSVGAVPGASVCPVPATGALVSYAYQGSTYQIDYVPGCGITQVTLPNGTVFTLVSVSTYPIGSLAVTRRLAEASPWSTIRSLLGRERNVFPAASLLR